MVQLNEVSKAKSVLMIKVKTTNQLRELADKLDQAYHSRGSEFQDMMVELVPGVNIVMDCNKEGFRAVTTVEAPVEDVVPLKQTQHSTR